MSVTAESPGRPGGYGMGEAGADLVVMVFHDPLLNGATISALRSVPLLEAHGWRFAFWAPAPGPCFDWLVARGAEVRGMPRPIASGLKPLLEPPGVARRLLATPGYIRAYARSLRELEPRLVHANSLFSFAEAVTARALRYPTLLHIHDMAPRGKLRAARAIARRGVAHAIAVSEACAASYAYDGWAPGLVYEAAPVPDEPVRIRDSPRPFVVGTVGVVARRKGSDLFVAAARELLGRDPGRYEFRMIGSPNDPLERAWGEAVISEAIAAGVTHMPEANVFAELRTWDAFALPSRMDPCPIVMLEAMAMGLPVIGARADGIPEQVTPECGLLVEADDASDLGQAIERVAGLDGATRGAMGRAGRERVRTAFSLDAQAAGLDRAYRSAIASS